MKKIYQKPKTKAIEVNTEHFIATSGMSTPRIESRTLNEGEDFD